MKQIVIGLLILQISINSFGQTIVRTEHKCLENYNDVSNLGGKLNVINYSNDTTYLELLTYGPCDSSLEIIAKNLPKNNAVDLEISNKSDSQSVNKCYCMFVLNPVIIGVENPKSKAWVLRNETAPRTEWEKWFWDHL